MLKFSNDLTKGVCSQCQAGAPEAQQIQGVSVQANNPSYTLYRFHFWEGGTLTSHLSLHGVSKGAARLISLIPCHAKAAILS